MDTCLQKQFAPHNACFGCGPANSQGLGLQSFVKGEIVVATWQPLPFHEAFPGVLNGGIIGTLLDCHSNWTAAYHLMKMTEESKPPCTVTAFFNVTLKRPTNSRQVVDLQATVKEISANRALIEAKLFSNDELCATCEGLFVAVKAGHPAYHRW
ncbi:PaaI family thioesterase [Candidatus Berkiella aquae]|uniref:PaaI family thioesterase n=1 Tax=Candidatus Berkiella aquae TaxID=295108 RepID=A0A0Q9YKC9_9GAMM|nr:PaaI family thioesterase [Candidatus Berkiella aquae]MCS5711197.1 PaaI family thioesterase [Candidatus Berkiella aquae]